MNDAFAYADAHGFDYFTTVMTFLPAERFPEDQ
jgi:hypothetical protein